MPYFKDRIPTSENIARVLWTKLETQKDIGTLHAIRLYEDEDLYADVTASGGLDVASVTRRYSFTAVQEDNRGHEWDCFVTVHGAIDPITGMVTDIGALDRLVQQQVVTVFDRQQLQQVLGAPQVTGEALARSVWDRLALSIKDGKLELVRLVQNRDLSFEYTG
jgi:6-pyruvoyltetrahydropterin/6-carboxytetrahydropterin synthase